MQIPRYCAMRSQNPSEIGLLRFESSTKTYIEYIVYLLGTMEVRGGRPAVQRALLRDHRLSVVSFSTAVPTLDRPGLSLSSSVKMTQGVQPRRRGHVSLLHALQGPFRGVSAALRLLLRQF